jgi:hypothetical protein
VRYIRFVTYIGTEPKQAEKDEVKQKIFSVDTEGPESTQRSAVQNPGTELKGDSLMEPRSKERNQPTQQ